MRNIFKWIFIGTLSFGMVSCSKFLDINKNPNAATDGPADLVLPQALTYTGSVANTYNTSLADVTGLTANIYGVGGYGAYLTYNYTTTSFTGLWTSVYDNAYDFQYIIDNTKNDPSRAFSTSIARIMKAFLMSKLVDQYNNVPYFDAFKGQQVLTPKYDDAILIYQDLVKECTESIAAITAGQAANATTPGTVVFPNINADPVFKALNQDANMTSWKQFANTLKLRLLVKLAFSGKAAGFATAQFGTLDNTLGFITDDVLVNPGYFKDAGRQNPTYNSWGYTVAGVRVNAQRVPTSWILSFFNGNKINDPGRGSTLFRGYPTGPVNQLGNENPASSVVPPTTPISSSSWYTGSTVGGDGLGFVKGATQGQPLMLLSEAKFLLAEAYARGYIAGGAAQAATAFNDGITASFRYFFKTAANTVDASKNVATAVATYKTDNAGNRLVDFSLNTTLEQQIEAIITQKYIALSYVTSDEIWNEFRRTAYPRIVNGSLNATETFASRNSNSTRPDKLPARFPYPVSEYQTNAGNIPAGIDTFTSRIFWDLN